MNIQEELREAFAQAQPPEDWKISREFMTDEASDLMRNFSLGYLSAKRRYEATDKSNQEKAVKTRQTFEEWYALPWPIGGYVNQSDPGAFGQAVWNAALASVVPGGRFELPQGILWREMDEGPAKGFAIYGFQTLHTEEGQAHVKKCRTADDVEMQYLGYIQRPQTVDLTAEEKLAAVFDAILTQNVLTDAGSWHRVATDLANGETIEQLYRRDVLGAPKEQEES